MGDFRLRIIKKSLLFKEKRLTEKKLRKNKAKVVFVFFT